MVRSDISGNGSNYMMENLSRRDGVGTQGQGQAAVPTRSRSDLARGMAVEEAVVGAKSYITGAISHAPGLGHGHGPVGHFWQWEQ